MSKENFNPCWLDIGLILPQWKAAMKSELCERISTGGRPSVNTDIRIREK